ncbi:MAG: hypothetical protein ACLUES_00305 [Flavonifractor plautii]
MEPLQPHQSRWYRRTDPQGRALLALLLPLAGVYLCQLVTLQEPAAAWAWMGSHAGAAGYTYLVLLLAQLLVTTLTDSLLCGQLLTLLPCLLLSVASHLKQAVNGVPLLVSDLAMAGQAGQVAGFLRPGMELGEGTWGGIALAGSVPGGLCLVPPARPLTACGGWACWDSGRPAGLGAESGLRRAAGRGGGRASPCATTGWVSARLYSAARESAMPSRTATARTA